MKCLIEVGIELDYDRVLSKYNSLKLYVTRNQKDVGVGSYLVDTGKR